MMDDDTLLLFSELIVLLAAMLGGRRIHVSTLHRWRSRGIGGQKLDAVRIGGRWFSSLAAVTRLCSQESPKDDTPPSTLGTPRRRASKAQTELKSQHGF